MGNPVFRFTLSHAILGSKLISEPDGWKEVKLKLERHEEYHSLVEYFEGSFVFYGSNGVDDGGADFIRTVESQYGFDAKLEIFIEIDINGTSSYEPLFSGLLDITELQEVQDNKIEVPIMRNDFWSRFIARRDTPVNLASANDLDGVAAPVASTITINMLSQKLRTKFVRNTTYNDANAGLFEVTQDIVGTTSYLMFGNGYNDLDEVEDRYEYGTQISSVIPTAESKFLFLAKYPGTYELDISIRFNLILNVARDITVKWYYASGKGTFTPTQIGATRSVLASTICTDGGAKTATPTLNLVEGDEVYIYGEVTLSAGATMTYFPDYDSDTGGPFVPVYTSLQVTANTTFKETTTPAYFIHSAGKSILNRIIGSAGSNEPFSSSYLANGCGAYYAVTPGLQIRGYSFSEKVFSISFNKWWNGVNPILNLGLGYDVVAGVDKIVVEPKEYFYNASSTSTTFSNVRSIIREYDQDRIYNRIEVGYNKWESESFSGLDDPQTKRTYSTIVKKVDNPLTIYSDFIAASIAIERARRERIEVSKDYRHDNDVFIIALNDTPVSSEVYEPELDENFSAITNLINSETRYNSYLTPLYNFLRWQNITNGCLQKYLSSVYSFAYGEGNYDMGSNTTNSCNGFDSLGFLTEKQDISIVRDYIHLPLIYTIEIDLTWEDYLKIRNNRTKAIGISQSESNYKRFFIKELTYEICTSKCKIIAWPRDEMPISVPESAQTNRPC